MRKTSQKIDNFRFVLLMEDLVDARAKETQKQIRRVVRQTEAIGETHAFATRMHAQIDSNSKQVLALYQRLSSADPTLLVAPT